VTLMLERIRCHRECYEWERIQMIAEQPNPAMTGLDLEAVIRLLHGKNIRVGIQTYGDGIRVWISDRLRVREERLFKYSDANSIGRDDSVALWLHAAALRLFTDKRHVRDSDMLEVGGNAATAGLGKRSAPSVPAGRAAKKQPAGPSKCYRLKGHKVGNRS
jgi:hypothetical protein